MQEGFLGCDFILLELWMCVCACVGACVPRFIGAAALSSCSLPVYRQISERLGGTPSPHLFSTLRLHDTTTGRPLTTPRLHERRAALYFWDSGLRTTTQDTGRRTHFFDSTTSGRPFFLLLFLTKWQATFGIFIEKYPHKRPPRIPDGICAD